MAQEKMTLHDRMIAYVDRLWFTADYCFEQALKTDNKVDAAFCRGQAFTLNSMATTILQWLYEYPPPNDKEWCICGATFDNPEDSLDHFMGTIRCSCTEHQLFRVGRWAWSSYELF